MFQSFSHSRCLSFLIFFICFDANDNNETNSAAPEPTIKPNTHKNLTLQKRSIIPSLLTIQAHHRKYLESSNSDNNNSPDNDDYNITSSIIHNQSSIL